MNLYQIQNKMFNLYCFKDIFMMNIRERMSPEAQRAYQDKMVRKLVRRAFQVPFYQQKYRGLDIGPDDIRSRSDLALLPTLTKAEYREWMNEELKDPVVKDFKLTHTSGSTGIPTTNIFPPKEYAAHYMADFNGWMRGGYNPFFGKTLTRQPGDPSVGTNSLIQKFGILRRECFNTKGERKDIVDKINSYRPDFILSNSSELIYLAEYILDNKITIHKPHYYCPTGENIDGLAERTLKSVFGEGLINIYGCTEMADFAVKIPGETGYDIMEDLVTVFVNTADGIRETGTGQLIVTPLYRLQYPMINYEIGDEVSLINKNGLDYIASINGRRADVFHWRSGKQTLYKQLEDINMVLQDIFQIRFIQESYENVRIQVVKDPLTHKTTEELEAYITEMYRGKFDEGVSLTFEWLKVIPPEANGKIRNMISYVGDQ